MAKTNDLGNDSVGKLLISLALPAIAAQIVNMLYNIVDRMYIGHIPDVGTSALTGVGVCFPVIMIIAAFSALVGMGGAPRASIKMGEGNFDDAENILGNCFITLFFISIALTVFFLIFKRSLLLSFGASADTIDFADSYLSIYIIGTIFVQMALGLNSFISSQGFAKISMLTVIIGAIINIALDPVFIFTFNMGVKGAALATVISQAVSAFWVIKFLSGNKTKLKIKVKYFKIKKSILFPVLALGVSPFVMQSTESLLNIAFNTSLQKFGGDVAVGAMTILASVMQVVSLPLTGLSQGAQPIVGFNYGAAKVDRVKKTFKLLFISSLIFSTSFFVICMLFPEIFIRMFSNDTELINFTVWAIRIYLAGSFMLGAQFSCQQTFIAVGQAKISLFLAILRKIILLIPLIYILPLFFENKVFGVFLAEPVADIIAASVTSTMFFTKFKKILGLVSNKKQLN